MSKTILSFEYDLPEDRDVFQIQVQAIDRSLAIDDFDRFLRSKIKNGIDPRLDLPTAEELSEIDQEYIHQIIAEHVFQVCRSKLWEIIRDIE